MVNRVERLAYIYGDCRRTKRRLTLIEPTSDPRDHRKKSRGGGAAFDKTVLGGGERERGGEEGKEEPFKEFGSRAEEGDGAVGGRGGRACGVWGQE